MSRPLPRVVDLHAALVRALPPRLHPALNSPEIHAELVKLRRRIKAARRRPALTVPPPTADEELPPAAPAPSDPFAGLRSPQTPMIDVVERAADTVYARYFRHLPVGLRRPLTMTHGATLVRDLLEAEGFGWDYLRGARGFLKRRGGENVLSKGLHTADLSPMEVLGVTPGEVEDAATSPARAQAFLDETTERLGVSRVTLDVRKGYGSWSVFITSPDSSAASIASSTDKTRRGALTRTLLSAGLWHFLLRAWAGTLPWTPPVIQPSTAGVRMEEERQNKARRKAQAEQRSREITRQVFDEKVAVYRTEMGTAARFVQLAIDDADRRGVKLTKTLVAKFAPRCWDVLGAGLQTPHGFRVYSDVHDGASVERKWAGVARRAAHLAAADLDEYESARRGYLFQQAPRLDHGVKLEHAEEARLAWSRTKTETARRVKYNECGR